MDIDSIIEHFNNLATAYFEEHGFEHFQNMRHASDLRQSFGDEFYYLDDGDMVSVVVKNERVKQLEYFGGFEYLNDYEKVVIGGWTIYTEDSGDDSRIAKIYRRHTC